jgi:hypothetical protein
MTRRHVGAEQRRASARRSPSHDASTQPAHVGILRDAGPPVRLTAYPSVAQLRLEVPAVTIRPAHAVRDGHERTVYGCGHEAQTPTVGDGTRQAGSRRPNATARSLMMPVVVGAVCADVIRNALTAARAGVGDSVHLLIG